MSLTIDANMLYISDKMDISSSRMKSDYASSTIDEIIENETKQGNTSAASFAKEYYHSTDKLVKLFQLANAENKFTILKSMDDHTMLQLLPLVDQEDLQMGLNFFTQEGLCKMLLETDIEQIVDVVKEAFPLEDIVLQFEEKDLAEFFQQKDLNRGIVMKELQCMPPQVFQYFIESTTGMPMADADISNVFSTISELPDDQFRDFMSTIDPKVQRQLTYQIAQTDSEYLSLFSSEAYVKMLNNLQKPDMTKAMGMLQHETLVNMMTSLPKSYVAIVATQINEDVFARFLQDGHMSILENASLI